MIFPLRHSLGILGTVLVCTVVWAAPAPWYFWRSLPDGLRVCAQIAPGAGWVRDSEAFRGPGCQNPRRTDSSPDR